ncbi:M56 family peptidase [Gramella sp. BOM4]|nr:M56 family peptidase [Christiangramia bathymodioli]
MEAFLTYLIKASALLGIFYLSYLLLLKKETSFQLNRKFFLAGLISSLILPVIYLKKIVYVENQVNQLNYFPANLVETSASIEPATNWWEVAGIAYIVVSSFFVLRLLLQLSSVFKLILNGKAESKNGFRYLRVSNEQLPFSFFNFIVFNPQKHAEKDLNLILEHEKVHASQFHSADVLLINLVSCLLWFNPFSWLYRKAMEQNLEFIADRETVRNKAEIKEYQHALVKVSVTNLNPALTNHFYQSFIKKRILMLNKKSSNQSPAWKLGLLMPLLLAFMLLFNVKTEAQVREKVQVSEIEKSQSGQQEEMIFSEEIEGTKTEKESTKKIHIEVEKDPQITWKAETVTGYSNKQPEVGINPLYIINGKEYKASKLRNKYVRLQGGLKLLPAKEAAEKFGDDARNGAVIINDAEIIRNFDKELDEIKGRKSKSSYVMVGNNGKPIYLDLNTGSRPSPRNVQTLSFSGNSARNIDAQTFVIRKDDLELMHPEIKLGDKEFKAIQFSTPDNFSQFDQEKAKTVIGYPAQQPLYIINDETMPKGFKVKSIDPNNIGSIKVLKGKKAVEGYGREGENGVIIIEMKEEVGSKETNSGPILFELTKNMTDSDLENLKNKVKEATGMMLEITNVERNKEGFIRQISISGKKNGQSASASWSLDEGIVPIQIGVGKNGSLIMSSSYSR